MKFLRGTFGFMLVGMLTMGVWGSLVDAYGLAGGFFAATIFIGPSWFLLHYLGIVPHKPSAAFVDLGFAVGFAGFFRDWFMKGSGAVVASLPTFAIVLIGGICGGVFAYLVEKDFAKDKASLEEESGF